MKSKLFFCDNSYYDSLQKLQTHITVLPTVFSPCSESSKKKNKQLNFLLQFMITLCVC